MRLVAVVVLVLGLVSVDSGFTLLGLPSFMNWTQSLMAGSQTGPAIPVAGQTDGVLLLNATNDGYSPRILHAPSGISLKLNMVTKETYSCARGFVIPALNVEKLLPANGSVLIDIPAQASGSVLQFTCSMGMYTGQIVFDQ